MADQFLFVQNQPTTLAGAGATVADVVVILTSFTTIDGTPLAMTDFGTVGYGTIDPGVGEFEEQISWTGIVQNANGTATLTGVKSVLFIAPYTETSGLAKSHAGGAIFVVSNTSGFYNKLTAKNDDETITGTWTFTNPNYPRMDQAIDPPIDDEQLATKKYVDDTAGGTPVSINRIVWAATAGETLAAGDIVYFDEGSDRWQKTSATYVSQQFYMLGIAQGAGTNGNPIAGGVLLEGFDSNQSGLTPGELYYLSDTFGDISLSPGTIVFEIGYAYSATQLYFVQKFKSYLTKDQQNALAGTAGTPNASNKFVTASDVASVQTASKVVRAAANGTLNDWNNQNFLLGETINGSATPKAVFISNGVGGLTAGRLYMANAANTASQAANFHGFVTGSDVAGATVRLYQNGLIPGFSGLSTGNKYFVDSTPGAITATPTATAVVSIGLAASATQVLALQEKKITVGTFSRAAATGTGNQVITGVGGRPQVIRITAQRIDSTSDYTGFSFCMVTNTTNDRCLYFYNSDDNTPGGDVSIKSGLDLTSLIHCQYDSGNMTASLVSIDSDGFTINWGVVSGDGTCNVIYEVLF